MFIQALVIAAVGAQLLLLNPCQAQQTSALSNEVDVFLKFFEPDAEKRQQSLDFLDQNWKEEYEVMVIEVVYLLDSPEWSVHLTRLLEKKTKQSFGYNFNDWYQWIWNKNQKATPNYPYFKAKLYKKIDFRFEKYFLGRTQFRIRLDEVRWGGVRQDGIPPLRNPKMISAKEADYLEDDNIVFGIEVNGEVRAYPKRILAWHEMFVDEVGGIPVAGVYCTLCGTVILYKTTFDGVNHVMGTSGFLYRSNKLMYDQATQSLWSTLWGEPVIGPLAGKGIRLEHLSVVTTTWGEWKKRHPNTQVLSLNTGYIRDYSEGVAYKQYFATDELMFNIPNLDNRLKNKAEVLALRFAEVPDQQLAISSEFLNEHPLFMGKLGNIHFVVLTDQSGGNRVYRAEGISFTHFDGNVKVTDSKGDAWRIYEDKLVSSRGKVLNRLPYHRAFWFGWYSAYPDTRLIY